LKMAIVENVLSHCRSDNKLECLLLKILSVESSVCRQGLQN
jgi:hypothetical protein